MWASVDASGSSAAGGRYQQVNSPGGRPPSAAHRAHAHLPTHLEVVVPIPTYVVPENSSCVVCDDKFEAIWICDKASCGNVQYADPESDWDNRGPPTRCKNSLCSTPNALWHEDDYCHSGGCQGSQTCFGGDECGSCATCCVCGQKCYGCGRRWEEIAHVGWGNFDGGGPAPVGTSRDDAVNGACGGCRTNLSCDCGGMCCRCCGI